MNVDKWYKEVRSPKNGGNRIEEIIRDMEPGDTLIVADISRLSRKIMEILHIIVLSMERGITLHCLKDGYSFGPNMDTQSLALAFGLAPEIERGLISSRTREALSISKSQGSKLSRPKGSSQLERLLSLKDQIEKDVLEENATYSELAEYYKVSLSSFKRFVKENLHLPPKKRGDR
ncbi:MAG: recombinase family protein [Tannerellaceae bacterium]|nr:recombinase family protein [Tannerellaceae bacterium]